MSSYRTLAQELFNGSITLGELALDVAYAPELGDEFEKCIEESFSTPKDRSRRATRRTNHDKDVVRRNNAKTRKSAVAHLEIALDNGHRFVANQNCRGTLNLSLINIRPCSKSQHLCDIRATQALSEDDREYIEYVDYTSKEWIEVYNLYADYLNDNNDEVTWHYAYNARGKEIGVVFEETTWVIDNDDEYPWTWITAYSFDRFHPVPGYDYIGLGDIIKALENPCWLRYYEDDDRRVAEALKGVM